MALLSVMASGHGAGTCSVLLMFFLWSTKCQKERDGECVSVWWSLASRRATALMAPSSPSQFLKSACQHLVGGVLSQQAWGRPEVGAGGGLSLRPHLKYALRKWKKPRVKSQVSIDFCRGKRPIYQERKRSLVVALQGEWLCGLRGKLFWMMEQFSTMYICIPYF